MVTSATIVKQKIYRHITKLCYSDYAHISLDGALIAEMLNTLESAMRNIITEADCWKIALACGSMWYDARNLEKMIVCHAISDGYCQAGFHYA